MSDPGHVRRRVDEVIIGDLVYDSIGAWTRVDFIDRVATPEGEPKQFRFWVGNVVSRPMQEDRTIAVVPFMAPLASQSDRA